MAQYNFTLSDPTVRHKLAADLTVQIAEESKLINLWVQIILV